MQSYHAVFAPKPRASQLVLNQPVSALIPCFATGSSSLVGVKKIASAVGVATDPAFIMVMLVQYGVSSDGTEDHLAEMAWPWGLGHTLTVQHRRND